MIPSNTARPRKQLNRIVWPIASRSSHGNGSINTPPLGRQNTASGIFKTWREIFSPGPGSVPISELTPGKLLEVLQRTKKRGALETAHRLLSNCTRVFRYAIATGRAKENPCDQLKGALPPVKGGHFAAVTEPKKVAEILKAIDSYEGTLTVRCALQLAPLVFVRPESFAGPSRRILILTAESGDIWSQRPKRPILSHFLGRPYKFCTKFDLSRERAAMSFPVPEPTQGP